MVQNQEIDACAGYFQGGGGRGEFVPPLHTVCPPLGIRILGTELNVLEGVSKGVGEIHRKTSLCSSYFRYRW